MYPGASYPMLLEFGSTVRRFIERKFGPSGDYKVYIQGLIVLFMFLNVLMPLSWMIWPLCLDWFNIL